MCSQDRATGPGDYEGDGGTPHRGPLRAERRLQILRRPVGLYQGSEQEQRSLHPHDGGLHSPQELLCNHPPFCSISVPPPREEPM